jgi:hypothetical protein
MANRTIPRICKHCGRDFLARKCDVNIGQGIYCSQACNAARRRTSPPRQPRLPAEERFWIKVKRSDGCWLWMGNKSKTGYGNFHAFGKEMRAHRYSYILHNGPIPEGICVLHRCDNPPCVNPVHLFLGTNEDNVRDKLQKGRQRWAEGMGPKLTIGQVREIRSALAAGAQCSALGVKYGVDSRTIHAIKAGRSWKLSQ